MCVEFFPGSWAYYMSDAVKTKPEVYYLFDFVTAILDKKILPQEGRYLLFKNRAPIELDFDLFSARPYFKNNNEFLERISKPEFVDIQVFWFKRKGDKNVCQSKRTKTR